MKLKSSAMRRKLPRMGGKQSYAAATLDETRELFEEGYEIADIATERGLTPEPSSIIWGVCIKSRGWISQLAHPGEEVVEQVRKIYKRLTKRQNSEHFNDDGSIKLRPIVELTTPKMAYDQVRLALLFVE